MYIHCDAGQPKQRPIILAVIPLFCTAARIVPSWNWGFVSKLLTKKQNFASKNEYETHSSPAEEPTRKAKKSVAKAAITNQQMRMVELGPGWPLAPLQESERRKEIIHHPNLGHINVSLRNWCRALKQHVVFSIENQKGLGEH